jgi:tetratricopeptide (TPR) repeat protein
MSIGHRLAATILLISLHNVAMAAGSFSFTPTPGEWASWPEYCRARYVTTSGGSVSEYSNQVPQETQNKWKTNLGRPFVTIHHYCAGMAWLQRAQVESDARKRQDALRKARNEAQFTFERVDEDHPIYGQIATHMGSVARAGGDSAAALKYFELAIRTHPEYAGGYQGYSLVLQDQGDLAGARDILMKGDSATGGESAEIHYFLGLALLRLKDYDNARLHAKRAYELGYPLPGLSRKLADAGYPLD